MSLVPPAPSRIVPGYRLDRYELLCPIAEGGMAQVWVARLRGKHGFQKLVAIKTILAKFAADSHFQQMFLDEARIASRIEHANVAQILDLGDEHGVLFLAMEWVDGDALTKLHRVLEKKKETIPRGILARILADTCGGLHAAHALRGDDGELLNVVHRDVSPQNILVSSRGAAKLIDFGIAKARDRMAADTNTGFLKGKVQYMAPEQAFGAVLDRRADVWAIGAILYHYLSGKPPFEGDNQLATLRILTDGKPPAPLPADVPAPLADVCMKALAHDPANRFATAAAMQAALEQAMLAAGITTTIADVATFIDANLADRAARRRDAVNLALAAAAERERINGILTAETEGPGSMSHAGGRATPAKKGADEPSGRFNPPSIPTVALARPPSPAVEVKAPSPPSVPTSATIAQAAVETQIEPLPMRRSPMTIPLAVGAVGVLLGVIVTVVLRTGDAKPATNAAQPPPSPSTFAVATAKKPEIPPPSPIDSTAAPPAASSTNARADAPAPSNAPSSPPPAARPAAAAPPAKTPPPAPKPPPAAPAKIPKVIDNGF